MNIETSHKTFLCNFFEIIRGNGANSSIQTWVFLVPIWGEEEALLTLSKNRAEAVKTYLVENGVDETQITTEGYGSSQPLAPNDTQAGKDQNKRTEIKIIK